MVFGCSSPAQVRTPTAPESATSASMVVKLQHPDGLKVEDLHKLFANIGAPNFGSLEKCDFDYQVERTLAHSSEELITAFRVHVQNDAEKYHWCFYAKLLELDESLKKEGFLEDKQKRILSAFSFITHLAKVFQIEREDTHYLRAAVFTYRELNRSHFFRDMKMTSGTRYDLLSPEFPEGLPQKSQKPSDSPQH